MKSRKGFTLVEVILAASMLVIGLLGILALYVNCAELVLTGRNLAYATNAIQLQIEDIRDTNFLKICSATDVCNPDPDVCTVCDGNTFTVDSIDTGNSRGVVYVNNLGGDILEVTVSVCWAQRNNRIIGEDLNLNGSLNAGEDLNGNGIIDSPAQLVTLITIR